MMKTPSGRSPGAFLERNGYRVLTAADGAEGLLAFRQQAQSVQVVLTDVIMPILDGPAMIRALRQVEPGLRIVAMSGLQAQNPETLGLGMNIDAFLNKPFTPAQLLGTCKKVLTKCGSSLIRRTSALSNRPVKSAQSGGGGGAGKAYR